MIVDELMLPKFGMNGYMAKSVVYSPHSHGRINYSLFQKWSNATYQWEME